jgi:hypothetical protein
MNTLSVIPDKRRSRAAPGSIMERRLALRWIPELRFAASGMTAQLVRSIERKTPRILRCGAS